MLTTITLELDSDDLRSFTEACAKRQTYLLPKGSPDRDGETSELRGLLLGEICRAYLGYTTLPPRPAEDWEIGQ